MTITAEEFSRKEGIGVCPGAPARFREAFGERFDATPESIRRAAEVWGAVWVAGHVVQFIPPVKLGRYLQAEMRARRAYLSGKALIPEEDDRSAEVARLRSEYLEALIEPIMEALSDTAAAR